MSGLKELQREWTDYFSKANPDYNAAIHYCATALQPHIEQQAKDMELIKRMLKEVEALSPDEDLHPKGLCRTCDLIRDARKRLEEV